MKQTTQKKPKTFRTLIRQMHNSRKTARKESNEPADRKKDENQEDKYPSFFGS